MLRKYLSLLTFSFLFLFSTFGQKYAKNQFTCFSYKVEIEDRVLQEFQKIESKINYNTAKNQTKVEAMLVHGLYNLATTVLADSLSIFILPPNSFANDIKYNVYGYPEINIQKALRLSDSKYFLKIFATIDNNIFDLNGKKLPATDFKPQITLKIDIYNKYGYLPIQTSESKASAIQPITFSQGFFAGLNFIDESVTKEPGQETLKDIFTRAIIEAVMVIKNNPPKK